MSGERERENFSADELVEQRSEAADDLLFEKLQPEVKNYIARENVSMPLKEYVRRCLLGRCPPEEGPVISTTSTATLVNRSSSKSSSSKSGTSGTADTIVGGEIPREAAVPREIENIPASTSRTTKRETSAKQEKRGFLSLHLTLDVRSPGEFAKGHVPSRYIYHCPSNNGSTMEGACSEKKREPNNSQEECEEIFSEKEVFKSLNLPLFTDEERREVGTVFKRLGFSNLFQYHGHGVRGLLRIVLDSTVLDSTDVHNNVAVIKIGLSSVARLNIEGPRRSFIRIGITMKMNKIKRSRF